MTTIEIDQLRDHINDALQQVEEKGEIVEVTRQGQVVARLVPVQPKPKDDGRSLMSKLRSIHIEGPEDFAANLDLYLSGEKQFEPDIR